MPSPLTISLWVICATCDGTALLNVVRRLKILSTLHRGADVVSIVRRHCLRVSRWCRFLVIKHDSSDSFALYLCFIFVCYCSLALAKRIVTKSRLWVNMRSIYPVSSARGRRLRKLESQILLCMIREINEHAVFFLLPSLTPPHSYPSPPFHHQSTGGANI